MLGVMEANGPPLAVRSLFLTALDGASMHEPLALG